MQVSSKSKRVSPDKPLYDLDREIFFLEFRPEFVMVAYCRDAAKKVPYAAPPDTDIPGDGFVPGDNISKSGVYVFPPVNVASMRWNAKPGMKGELQMVVRIDQARQ